MKSFTGEVLFICDHLQVFYYYDMESTLVPQRCSISLIDGCSSVG